MTTYSGIIEPMTSLDKWPEPGLNPIQPPPEISLPGRPKKKRNKSNNMKYHLVSRESLGRMLLNIIGGVK